VMVTCRVYPAGAKIGKCRMNLSGISDEFSSVFQADANVQHTLARP